MSLGTHFNIRNESWESLVPDRPFWGHLISKKAHAVEKRRSLQAEQKSAARKVRANTINTTPSLLCPTCGRCLLARIGLISHLQTHRSISSANYEGRTTTTGTATIYAIAGPGAED